MPVGQNYRSASRDEAEPTGARNRSYYGKASRTKRSISFSLRVRKGFERVPPICAEPEQAGGREVSGD